MGELHLEVVLERLGREYGLKPRSGRPQVVRMETLSAAAAAESEFDKQLGDHLHYGWIALSVEPRGRGKGHDVVFEFDLSHWPTAYATAVEEGIKDGLQSGALGYPVCDVRVRVRRITSYNVCYTKLLRARRGSLEGRDAGSRSSAQTLSYNFV